MTETATDAVTQEHDTRLVLLRAIERVARDESATAADVLHAAEAFHHIVF